jgi:hypothetical protein
VQLCQYCSIFLFIYLFIFFVFDLNTIFFIIILFKKSCFFLCVFLIDFFVFIHSQVIDALGGHRHSVSDNPAQNRAHLLDLKQSIGEVDHVLKSTIAARMVQLQRISGAVVDWEKRVRVEKAVCHTLNKFDFESNRAGIVGEGWCAKHQLNLVKHALQA